MREIVLDTETTGLSPFNGDRVVEIGCVELINHVATGVTFHRYMNPERDMPMEAFNVHGLSEEFLSDKPLFAEIVDEFLEFIGESQIIAHNAGFDMGFINAELQRASRPQFASDRATDTVVMARRKYPGAQASLDALCKRFGVDNSNRVKHGALLDAELLAEVYLELVGGREPGLALAGSPGSATSGASGQAAAPLIRERPFREPRPHAPDEAELAAHAAFVARLKNPIWTRQPE